MIRTRTRKPRSSAGRLAAQVAALRRDLDLLSMQSKLDQLLIRVSRIEAHIAADK